jgi:hypothetical protein
MAKPLDTWLASKFEPPHLAATIDELTAATSTPPAAGTGDDEIKAKLDDCDRKLTQYRAVLSAGAASVASDLLQAHGATGRTARTILLIVAGVIYGSWMMMLDSAPQDAGSALA